MSETRPRSNRSGVPGIARHGRLKKSHATVAVLKFLAAALAVVLVSGACVAGIALSQIKGNIKTVTLVGETDGPPPALGAFDGGFNLLLVGSDTRKGQGAYAGKDDGVLNDVTMLLHVSQDQTNAVAVSIPRDMVVPIPACPREDGKGNYGAMSAQPINNTLAYGGLPCTVVTVKALTGLDIPFAALITFQGVIDMSTAVGGVPVCINGPLRDKYSGIDLPAAGTYTLSGFQALAFLRSRHGVGDGSDLGRISSQQVFLSSLVRTVKSDSTLTDFTKLFGLATAASKNMTLSKNLSNLNTMVSIALVLKKIPLNRISFVQYPGTTGVGGVYAGKVAPIVSAANALFAKIKADEPFSLDSGTGRGSIPDPNAPAPTAPAPSGSAAPDATASDAPEVLPGVLGQTAADYTCSKVNK
ncbi:LCP family protein [Lacisediminihabitans profunda]|uniref:LytR family transcriptional regulator n=2 Tax=Lacisediminihabitans profunda TaxID=2594790 RepID=A0A5C8UPT3_9MICO|nr:LCP family protein [Lacisediminihabitans profunda]TXN29506.1 LytR family transcriptional regulator [Lacisediminihabitans profunda]